MEFTAFLPARVLMNMHSIEWDGISTKFIELERLIEEKRAEAKDSLGRAQKGGISLEESIRRNGVIKPIRISFRRMWIRPAVGKEDDWWENKEVGWHIEDGHHRLIVAYDLNPDMKVPAKINVTGSWGLKAMNELLNPVDRMKLKLLMLNKKHGHLLSLAEEEK